MNNSSQELIKLLVALSLVLLFASGLFAETDITRDLKIVRTFPSEKQSIEHDYVLDRGHFVIADNELFFCSQPQHRIFVLDLHGNLLRTIGRRGQGPGEFQLPRSLYAFSGYLYVLDNMNARIQIISKDGEFKKAIKLADTLGGIAVAQNKMILNNYCRRNPEDVEGFPVIGIYNMDGFLEKRIYSKFASTPDEFYSQIFEMRLVGKYLHCLQRYGTDYKIFDLTGDLIDEFRLQYNPFKDRDHKKTGYLWGYKTFCTDGTTIYVPLDVKGKVCILAFDMKGRLIRRYESRQDNADDVYNIMDMTIHFEAGRKFLFLFQCSPIDIMYVAELEVNP